mgnify:CR=1 FL=1
MGIETNNHGVNKAITYTILSNDEMGKIGFTNYYELKWFFMKSINFPKEKRYRGFDITFSVSIPKDNGDIRIDILDEDFLQPYDYQKMLISSPDFEPCLIVKEQVEKWMEYLKEQGVLHGHKYGEYI